MLTDWTQINVTMDNRPMRTP